MWGSLNSWVGEPAVSCLLIIFQSMSFPLPPILQASLLLFLPESWVFLIVLAPPGYNTMLPLLKKICPISFNCDFCDIQSLALIGVFCRWTNNCWSVSKASCVVQQESWASREIVADSHLWMCLCFCVGHCLRPTLDMQLGCLILKPVRQDEEVSCLCMEPIKE